ncbi:MAG: CPBP family intramembrane metalloprotease [Clostridiales bacterium]|nr:CPBP family intramembrane metalloprotease [Clostridiales bacterium]
MRGGFFSFAVFVWRMVSPLIVYDWISEWIYVMLMVRFGGGHLLLVTAAGAAAASFPLGIWYLRWCRGERKKGRVLLPERKFGTFSILNVAGLGISLCVFFNILIQYLPISWESFESVGEALYEPSVGVQLVCMGLIVPFAEELVFRGLGYRRMREMVPAAGAAILSAVYFGAFHGNLVQAVYAGVLGLFLAGVMEHYGTIAAPYVLHASANMMSVLLSNTFLSWVIAAFAPVRWSAIAISGVFSLYFTGKIRKEER